MKRSAISASLTDEKSPSDFSSDVSFKSGYDRSTAIGKQGVSVSNYRLDNSPVEEPCRVRLA